MRILLPLLALFFIATPAFASQQAYSLPDQTSFTIGYNYGQGGVDYPIFQDNWPQFFRCAGTVKETSLCTFVDNVGANWMITVSSVGLPNGQYWYRTGQNCNGITFDACRIQSGQQVDNVSVYVDNGFFSATPAPAVTFSQVPSGNVQNPVSVEVTIGSPADLDNDTQTSTHWFVEIWGATNSAVLSTGCVATTDASGVYTFSGTVPAGNYDTVAISGTGAGCISANSGGVITQAVNFTVLPTPTTTPTTTPPTAGAFSFVDFNDVSPTEMIASVQAGTVGTTDKVLPLLTLLGIPLGFLLVLMLIGMINKTLTPEKTGKKGRTEIINPKGDDIVYHSAKDLEFKRNYGRRKE